MVHRVKRFPTVHLQGWQGSLSNTVKEVFFPLTVNLGLVFYYFICTVFTVWSATIQRSPPGPRFEPGMVLCLTKISVSSGLDGAPKCFRSESRNDILDSDHSLYDHSATANANASSLYYQPAQYTGFVRTCDGKFIRQVGGIDTPFSANNLRKHTRVFLYLWTFFQYISKTFTQLIFSWYFFNFLPQ